MKVAVVDLGTNTCRLFLARVEDGRVLQDDRVTTVVRLGQGVDKTGQLHPDAVARTHACLAEYAPRVEAYGPARRLLVATSVLRDARDGRQFLRAIVAQEFRLPWRVLRGEEEAALAFRGGTSRLAGEGAAGGRDETPDPILLVDIGGGSTEFAIGTAGGCRRRSCAASTSASVRLTERFFHADPPPPAEIAALAGHVAAAVEEAVPAGLRAEVRGMVGVAGTYTTLVANKLGMTEYDADARPGPRALPGRHRRCGRPVRRTEQRRARPAAGHPARPRGRHPRRGAHRPRGLPRLRPRRRERQRGRHP